MDLRVEVAERLDLEMGQLPLDLRHAAEKHRHHHQGAVRLVHPAFEVEPRRRAGGTRAATSRCTSSTASSLAGSTASSAAAKRHARRAAAAGRPA